jgi:diaminopimelate decarboxylase
MNFLSHKTNARHPSDWGLKIDADGILCLGDCRTIDLAAVYGTPLHVVHEERLAKTAEGFRNAFIEQYPGLVSLHYAFKCNPVPGVISIIRSQSYKAEIMSPFELELALKLGYTGDEIIVNGPFKSHSFIAACLRENVRLIIIDSVDELSRVNKIAEESKKIVSVLLRINPDFTPKGMNKGTSTGDRKGCAFGLDLKGGEAMEILPSFSKFKNIVFKGFHFHIGTGIRDPEAYYKTILLLKPLIQKSKSLGLEVAIIDVGGGIASFTTREMTTFEMLWYQATNKLPSIDTRKDTFEFKNFADAITKGLKAIFEGKYWPELILEPGRSIVSANQLLLIGVHAVKERKGVRKWLVTDGGIGTVSMPTFYEFHEVFLCNDMHRQSNQYVTINGPGCFAADVVYSNNYMPEIDPGDTLAIMDSGAYFTSWESNFGYPRPAVIGVKKAKVHVLRRRESTEEMMMRDNF